LTFTDMAYPFVAAFGTSVALAASQVVCYNAARFDFNRQGPGTAPGPQGETS